MANSFKVSILVLLFSPCNFEETSILFAGPVTETTQQRLWRQLHLPMPIQVPAIGK